MPTHAEKLTVEQGADYRHVFPAKLDDGSARNFNGWKAEGVVRHHAADELLYQLPLALSAGRVVVTIPGADSEQWQWRNALYEIKLSGPKGERERFASGGFSVDPQLVW